MRHKRSGFSLVLSLTVMAAMVMLVIVLASFLQVESRLAQSHAGYLRARFNALASARVAIGQLQATLGPDQRVSMRADMFSDGNASPSVDPAPAADKNPNKPSNGIQHQKRYWTGVWSTGGADTSKPRDWNVADPHDTRLFLGWLTSPTLVNAGDPELIDPTLASLNYYLPNRNNFIPVSGKVTGLLNSDGQKLINALGVALPAGDFVRLVGGSAATNGQPASGSIQWPTSATSPSQQRFYGAIDLPAMPLPGPSVASGGGLGVNGRFAYWIGDEGIKAKVNLPDVHAVSNTGAPLPGLTDWDRGFAGSAAQRSSFESVRPSLNATAALMPANFDSNYLSLRNLDILATIGNTLATWKDLGLTRTRSRSEINAWAKNLGSDAAGNAITTANRLLWHEITPWSFSVLSDTLNGGMKTDLSTAFELPYSVYRTLEVFPGQKENSTAQADRKPSFFHGAPNATTAVGLGLASDLDYNRPNLMDKIGSPQEILRASPRSPEWAPRYLSQIPNISTTVELIRRRNGGPGANGEMPERLGFAYEVPLSSRFFNQNRIDANVQSGAASAPSDVFTWPNHPLGENHVDNWTARIVRGPTWDLYRNHYRMYKREIEAAAATPGALRGQGADTLNEGPGKALGYIARGIEPLTYATGHRGYPVRLADAVSGDAEFPPLNPMPNNFFPNGDGPKYYHYRNNLADGGVGPDFLAQRRYRDPFTTSYRYSNSPPSPTSVFRPATNTVFPYTAAGLGAPTPSLSNTAQFTDSNRPSSTRTWPTSPILAPTILRFSTVYSAIREPDTTGKVNLGMSVNPIVVIHNPYDVALEFEGLAMVTNGASSPFRFLFRLQTNFLSTEYQYTQASWETGEYDTSKWPLDPLTLRKRPPNPTLSEDNMIRNANVDIGDVVIGGGEADNRSMSFRIVAGPGGTTGPAVGNVIRLEPGEIRVLGAAPSAGGLVNSTNTNVSIPGEIGFTDENKAFYKMTPFHNVRSRMGSGARNAERALWTLDFELCKIYAEYEKGGAMVTWNSPGGGLDDKEYARRLYELWDLVQNQRKVHDAMISSDGKEKWDGSAASLNRIRPQAIKILPRNSGWLNYNGYVVGAECERIDKGIGADGVWGVNPATMINDDTYTYVTTDAANYEAPFRRNGKIALVGNQSWNFYLIGKKSIDGGAQLNTHRRWFGTPDENASSYIQESLVSPRRIKKYAEGTQTVRGFNCVDESLLLNFQAMTAGWPMYSNSNHDSAYFTVPDLLWTKKIGIKNPDFRIEGSTGLTTPDGVRMNPFQKDPEFNNIEPTADKANTLFLAEESSLSANGLTTPVLGIDFVLRAADMTGNTTKWYPTSNGSAVSNFGMMPSTTDPKYGPGFIFQTPEEMRNAPMTPYFLSYRAQQAQLFGYDGKAHTPVGWIQSQRSFGQDPAMLIREFPTTADGRAFWGASIDDATGGKSNVILYSIPRRPLLSLSQLGTVAFAEKSTDADFTVGSSFAHPGIGDLTRIVEWPGPRDLFPSESSLPADVKGPVPELGYVGKHMSSLVLRNRTDIRTDHAFAANLTLWDSYYFSGLNLQANSFSHRDDQPANWPSGGDLPIDLAVAKSQADALKVSGLNNPASFAAYKEALNEGKNLLANKRMVYMPDGKPSFTTRSPDFRQNLELPESEFPHPKYLARNSLYDGGFNVNSTSRAAWKAVLAGLRGQALPDAANPKTDGTALTKFARAFGPADKTGNDPWTSYRELNDKEIDDLAGAVVEEIRARGPFMSLADFVNRRLINDDNFGLKGALQAAIDKTSINNTAIAAAGGTFKAPPTADLSDVTTDPNSNLFGNLRPSANRGWWTQRSAYPPIPANQRFPSLKAMSQNPSASNPDIIAGLGAPGIVTQMDVLNSIGPNLTARSDTFVVRAYGEALDDAGNVIGKAWVEVVVQRTTEYVAMAVGQKYPDYVEPNRRRLAYRVNSSGGKEYDRQVLTEMYEVSPPPTPTLNGPERTALSQEQRLNRILGRRFRPTSLRWLSANEI